MTRLLEPSITDELQPLAAPRPVPSLRTSLLVLFKARVVLLLLSAAVGGAFLAAGGWPGMGSLARLLFIGGLAASGASAINQYLEKDLDGRMERTRGRPLPARSFAHTRWVPYVGALMILLPAVVGLLLRPALSFFVLLGAAIYLGVYTIWLKPRTPLNIVVGGAAGSMAVLSGSAAVGRWDDPGALILALLVFLWTPTHFWSLSIACRDDYARGGFPMLPVHIPPRAAAWWVLLHTSGTALGALALAVHPRPAWLYAVPVGLATAGLLVLSGRLVAKPSKTRALVLFHASNLYLAIVMLMVCLNAIVS